MGPVKWSIEQTQSRKLPVTLEVLIVARTNLLAMSVRRTGHEAGYAWAEEHDIADGDAYDTAGEHSNSPSFAEGCHAYVDGDADPEQSKDTDDDN
jgi:hypothetical protein